MVERTRLLDLLARELVVRDPGHPLRVGIDGPCGVGKTRFGHDLARALTAVLERDASSAGARPVVLLDSDGFHHVRERRYRQGRASPRGYYEDAYDLDALRERVLVPLGPGGSRVIATKVHDMGSDEVVTDQSATVPPDAVVLFDTTFLQRADLRAHWDVVVYLDADREVAHQRGVRRDAAAMGGVEAAARAHEQRYRAAFDLYVAEEAPRDRADIVIRHDDPADPAVLRGL